MSSIRIFLSTGLAITAACLSFGIGAQVADGSCILAGRVTAEGRWAPRFAHVELLGQDGKAISSAGKSSLSSVRQVRLSQPALLARCDGDKELTRADDLPLLPKTAGPAASAGLFAVEAVQYPRLRTGGELVELKLSVAPERVVMLTR